MAVTQQEVDQAQQTANDAQQHADDTQKTADASRDAARQSRAASDQARPVATAADSNAAAKEAEAARQKGDADAAARSCQNAQAAADAAQQDLKTAQANAQSVHARFPNKSNAETAEADQDVAVAKSEASSANAHRDSTCAEADRKRKAAEGAATEAKNARDEANRADAVADSAKDRAEKDEEKARNDQKDAQAAVVDAASAKTKFDTLKAEFDKQAAAPPPQPTPAPIQAQPPGQPNLSQSAGHTGQKTPPGHGAGIAAASLFDLNFTFLTGSWTTKEGWHEAPLLFDLTEGHKHRITFGEHFTFVGGLRTEETLGPDFKVTLAGDWRKITGDRIERNAGWKVESILSEVDETVHGTTSKTTPVLQQDKSPTSQAGKGPEFQHIASKMIRDFKNTAFNKYKVVSLQANRAKFAGSQAYLAAKEWNRRVAEENQKMDEHLAKLTELQEKYQNFKIKAADFVKFIASAGIKLTSGKLTARIDDKMKVIASSMAEFKGDIKLGG
jgi:hypothetical protein